LARFHRPKNAYEGKFSIPYCIATALRKGKISLEDFTDGKVADPETQALLSKVDFEYPDEYIKDKTSLTQEVVVRLRNGAEYSRKVEVPKGDPENPLTDEEISAKFIDCTRSVLSQTKIEKALEMVARLESLKKISQLMKLITFTAELGNDKT